ncbi:hypothetical protein PRIC1_000102 [Phytophthora ramorum]
MSEDAAAKPAESAPTPAPQPEPQVTVDIAVAQAVDNQTATPRKRRTPSPSTTKKVPAEGEDTESEPEKQPKKRAKTGKRGPGRRKKVVEPEAGDEQQQAERKVAALGDDIKRRFGQIVWAKMGGYPYWPCIITDPRLLPSKLQETALKVLETKYLVFFYVSNNFAPVSFKMIEPWDDTKLNYREGHPEKDSKAPKRRVKLMAAIEVADKEIKLPIEERADGLLKPDEKVEAAEKEEAPVPVKRKPGRPPKNKTAANAAPSKTPKKRGPKPKNRVNQAADEKNGKGRVPAATQEEEEDTEGPTLSKEEIKAKVASRKTPKKKGADDGPNAAGGSAKKALKPTAKHGKSNGSTEIDSKRKKEIELVVPHKSVKSADIREMTEEAAKKKLSGPKSKTKDKGEYKVGDLASCASKMARLQAKESARNNDELVGMMQELFKETLMYRSDVERSGLAAVIAMLRKNLSPTVAQTASALRKHMINILSNDTEISHLGKKGHQNAEGHSSKKRKAENGSSHDTVKSDELKPKTEASAAPADSSDGKDNLAAKETVASPPANASPTKKAVDVSSKDAAVKTKEKETPDQTAEKEATKAAPSEDVRVKTDDAAEKTETATVPDKRSSSPTKVEDKPTDAVANGKEDVFEAPENLDKNRKIFVDMLSKILDHEGSNRADLANEIDAALFERFKESNDDYLTQARIIIFGLKENAPMRERLYSGALHCLEFAYADDAFFKVTE